ncbi:MAG: DUF5317 domain-containing protein [Eubacteriales bacterium]
MVIILLIIGIIIGFIRKGNLNNLAQLHIQFLPLIILSFLIQISIYVGYRMDISILKSYDILLHFISYIILFAGLMSNFHNKWFIVITLGVIGNFMVIFLNGGKMPVSLDAAAIIGMTDSLEPLLKVRGGTHQILNASTIFPFLADVIPIALPEPANFMNNIYSIGDFILYSGTMGLLQSAMAGKQNTVEKEMTVENIPNNAQPDEMYSELSPYEERIINEYNQRTKQESLITEQDTVSLSYNSIESIASVIENNEKQNDEYYPLKEILEDHDDEEDFSIHKEEILQNEKEPEKQKMNNSFFVEDKNQKEQMYEIKDAVEQDPMIEEVPFIEEETKNLSQEYEQEQVVSPQEYIDQDQVDTTHQFIIVNGKIVENPYYHRRVDPPVQENSGDITFESEVEHLESRIDEIEMSQLDLNEEVDKELNQLDIQEKEDIEMSKLGFNEEDPEVAFNKHLLQDMTDSERIDFMKKMKRRKENGYTLEQISIGDKHISFWKKDLNAER